MLLLSRWAAYTRCRKLTMDRHLETVPIPATQKLETAPHVIEYSKLVACIQLSAARLLNLRGSLEATSFAEVLVQHTDTERDQIIRNVGAEFDQGLINYVTTLLITSRHNRNIIIQAESTEGIDGHLPWVLPLQTHLEDLRASGTLRDATVQIERISAKDEMVATLTHEAQTLAA